MSKIEQVKHLLCDSNLDFLCLSETWLNKNSPSAALNIPGYNLFRRDRVKGKGGGVMVYLKNTIHCTQIQLSNVNLECIGLTITLSSQMSFVMFLLYRPPSSTNAFYDEFKRLLKEYNSKQEVLLLGDFNINWDDKRNRNSLKRITDNMDFTQLIKGPTRLTASSQTQIDLLFTNRPERVEKTYNFITGLTDHNLILFSRKLTKNRFRTNKYHFQHTRIPKSELENFHMTINKVNWNEIITGRNVEEDSERFINTIQSVAQKFTKTSQFKKKSKKNCLPWLSTDLLKLMKDRDHVLKDFLKFKLPIDRQKFVMLRNRVTRELRKAKANFFISIIHESKGNTTQIWEHIKKLIGVNNSGSLKQLQLKLQGKISVDPFEMAEAFKRHFIDSVDEITQSFTETKDNILVNCQLQTSKPQFCLSNISEQEVLRIIKTLKTSKAKDCYGMDSIMLKSLKDCLAPSITNIINLSISQGIFPNTWKTAIVSPIFKGGDPQTISNYRPISILPVVSKVMEKWVSEKIVF